MADHYPVNNRMRRDVLALIQSKFEVVVLGSLNDFRVKVAGPADTPYEGGLWWVRVHLEDDYPFKSPSITFVTKIFHPNIDEVTGTVCMNVINQAWTALYDLFNIFEIFLPQLLTYPNPDDPINLDAAKVFKNNPEEYKRIVKIYVKCSVHRQSVQPLNGGGQEETHDADDSASSLSDHDDDERSMEK